MNSHVPQQSPRVSVFRSLRDAEVAARLRQVEVGDDLADQTSGCSRMIDNPHVALKPLDSSNPSRILLLRLNAPPSAE